MKTRKKTDILLFTPLFLLLFLGYHWIPSSPPQTEEPEPIHTQKILEGISLFPQEDVIPQGCEVASLSIVLDYYGISHDIHHLVEEYLPQSGIQERIKNPEIAYVGDPFQEGWYCFQEPLLQCANQFLTTQTTEITGKLGEFHEIDHFVQAIDQEIPVIVWVTTTYTPPLFAELFWFDGSSQFPPYGNLHCVTVVGYDLDENLFYLADTLKDTIFPLDIQRFFVIYEAMGSRSIFLS